MNDPQKVFGLYLRELRKNKKISMKKLEELSGVSNAYISNLENGKRGIPSPEVLKKLHGPLGVSYDELMERAGHISSAVRSELIQQTVDVLESHNELAEIISKAADIYFSSVTDQNGNLLNEYKEYMFQETKNLYPYLSDKEIIDIINNPNFLKRMFNNLVFEEKISFLNTIIRDFSDRDIDPMKVFDTESANRVSILKVPVMGYIAAGSPIFADEHIEEWTEVPNMWNLREKEVFILKVKGDSMIGSRIFDGDKVVVKIQQEVENGEIAVVNVNGEEATLKRVKKKENGQVILYPDNPKYEPTYITNESARIVGKVIQVMFEP
jgi:SOS regulatory protein LexA